MIPANELRINNRYRLNGKEFTLDMKMMYAFCSGSFQYDLADVEGIFIAPEHLTEGGFTNDPELRYRWYKGKITYDLDDGGFCYDGSWNFPIIAHLHSLQTLYYALTEEELITPKT